MAKSRYTIKQILLSQQAWWHFFLKHRDTLRPAIVTCVIKLLSCKNKIRGYQEFSCPTCPHIKYVAFTCKSRACSSCGKKATENWILKQNERLPRTSWQHITFTMPCELWDFFWLNRHLFDNIGSAAAHCIQSIADAKGVIPGIFIAIHTFGRNLKRNVHVHLSTTTGGLSKDLTQWKNLFFVQHHLMTLWRYAIITMFRNAYKNNNLILPKSIKQQLNRTFTFNNFLDALFKKPWIVHCSKPSDSPELTIAYLSRYLKRPAIAESKLMHYDGHEVTFKYLDHVTKRYRRFTLSVEEFIGRFVQHIPDTGFRLIRYYGFLAHRVSGKLLPIVYELLGQNKPKEIQPLSFAQLIQKNFNFNPLLCIICGGPLLRTGIRFGYSTAKLIDCHRELALMKKC